ncbi:HAD hydrolase-like protein [Ornithinimicrobium flavum]|uniref:HAD hydrolase-like protein n=1 Tax=Ornithinimicrobium flavum TaxID=1288636 RepID=UPI00130512BF|nr:HAD hydrolase-like protein [Ornithinimicrobium flavum]
MSRWPVVLFDFDGTLADTLALIVASYRHTLADLEPTVSEREIRSWIGRTLVDTLESRHPGRGEDLVARYRAHNLAHHDDLLEPVPGLDLLLSDLLAGGTAVGVVSSKVGDTVRRGMAVAGLPHVEVVVGLGETTEHKPHPAPLLEGARRLGLLPGEVSSQSCVYVGDAWVDVAAARAAGMASVAVTWGAGSREELADADHLVHDVERLRALLRPGP